MPNAVLKRITVLLCIVARGKGAKLIKHLKEKNIPLHMQSVGFGTAPTEMMDIFGLGSNDKDIVLSLASKSAVGNLMADFNNNFSNTSEYGGLMIVMNISATNRLVSEILNHNTEKSDMKVSKTMKNEHQHHLILITVNEGYSDQVMQTAKRAGATGGTIVRGRFAGAESFLELAQIDVGEEREIICILAPKTVSNTIMEDVNEQFGLASDARGMLCAIPVDKAYKI